MLSRMRMRSRVVLCCAAAVVVAAGMPALASPWTNEEGANSAFGWSGGNNTSDHFGDPGVTPAGFFFHDLDDFRADGGGGFSETTADTANVTVDTRDADPVPGPAIDMMLVREWGTWQGDDFAADFVVNASVMLFRQWPLPPSPLGPVMMTVTHDDEEHTWSAQTVIELDAWNRFDVSVNDSITVNSSAPANSWIEKTGMEIIVPEPTSMLFLLGGFGMLAVRRSRR